MIGIQIVEILATLVEALCGVWTNTEILHCKVSKKKIILGAIILAAAGWLVNQFKLFSLMGTAVYVIGIPLIVYIIAKGKVVDSLIVTMLYTVVLYIVDFTSISVFGIIFNEEKMAQIIATETSIERVYLLVFSKVFLMISSYWLIRKWLSKVTLPARKLGSGVVLCCCFLFYLVKRTYSEVNKDVLVTWLFFLIIIFLATYSFIQYNRSVREKNLRNLLQERTDMQMAAYNQLVQDYNERQKFYHDIANHHLIIFNYIKAGEYQQAAEYLQKLQGNGSSKVYRKRTGINVIDMLLDSKIKTAESCQIKVEEAIEIIHLQIPENDIISLFGNALDNAIEACKRMNSSEKWIRIWIRQKKEMTVIKISNSYEENLIERDGIFVSRKENPSIHGLGIKSMRDIVVQYNGKLKIQYDKETFEVTICFFE